MHLMSQLDPKVLDNAIFNNPNLGGRLQQLFSKIRARDGDDCTFPDQASR